MAQVEKLVYRNDHCGVPDYENDAQYHPHLSFHYFLKYSKLKKGWVIKIWREESKNNKVLRGVHILDILHLTSPIY